MVVLVDKEFGFIWQVGTRRALKDTGISNIESK
jgi:hypothetical protein